MAIALDGLPDVVMRHILRLLTYEEVSELRLVSKTFDSLGQCHLNAGLSIAEQYLVRILKKVKALLPRRESERRKHKLSRYSDILSALETRVSLLRMTYGRYMESGLCCFIPGKVLDELFRVLRIVDNFGEVPRLSELLQELRDISSMAMEHFEESIASSLKDKLTLFPPDIVHLNTSSRIRSVLDSSVGGPSRCIVDVVKEKWTRDRTVLLKMQKVKKSTKELTKTTNELAAQVVEHEAILEELRARITEQDATIHELQARITEQDVKLSEMVAGRSTGLDIVPVLRSQVKRRQAPTPDSPKKKRKT